MGFIELIPIIIVLLVLLILMFALLFFFKRWFKANKNADREMAAAYNSPTFDEILNHFAISMTSNSLLTESENQCHKEGQIRSVGEIFPEDQSSTESETSFSAISKASSHQVHDVTSIPSFQLITEEFLETANMAIDIDTTLSDMSDDCNFPNSRRIATVPFSTYEPGCKSCAIHKASCTKHSPKRTAYKFSTLDQNSNDSRLRVTDITRSSTPLRLPQIMYPDNYGDNGRGRGESTYNNEPYGHHRNRSYPTPQEIEEINYLTNHIDRTFDRVIGTFNNEINRTNRFE